MIHDTLANAARYAESHTAFADAFAWLSTFDESLADGTHPLSAGCEARVMSYTTGAEEEKRWESHRRFIDIQYMLHGDERMDVSPIAGLGDATPYDDANDVLFYSGASGAASSLIVRAGEFTVFFPHDGHRPSIRVGASAPVRKIVVKVPVERPG